MSVALSINDTELNQRIDACFMQETREHIEVASTMSVSLVRWYVVTATDVAAAYEAAILAENPSPGSDPAVVTDAMILANVQAFILKASALPS